MSVMHCHPKHRQTLSRDPLYALSALRNRDLVNEFGHTARLGQQIAQKCTDTETALFAEICFVMDVMDSDQCSPSDRPLMHFLNVSKHDSIVYLEIALLVEIDRLAGNTTCS